jgi:hypothetical protein
MAALPGLTRSLAVLGLLVASAACSTDPVSSGRPGNQPDAAMADFAVGGQWQRCHQMGMCVYRLDVSTPGGTISGELEPIGAMANSGALAPGNGIPARLPLGPTTLTFVSTMLGDTLEPNGEQTVLGEDARCEVELVIDTELAEFSARVTFAPGKCTIELAKVATR